MAKVSVTLQGEEMEVGKVLRENAIRVKLGKITFSSKREIGSGKSGVELSPKGTAISDKKGEE